MLQLVRNTWVVGVLEQSLHGAPIRDLFDECSGALLILGKPSGGYIFVHRLLQEHFAFKVQRTFEVRCTSTVDGRNDV